MPTVGLVSIWQGAVSSFFGEGLCYGMTKRSVFLGLFCAAAICGFTYFNDAILRQSLIVGNHMPIAVYGPLLVFLLTVNPLLAFVSRKVRIGWGWLKPLSAAELSVVIALSLASCCVPYSSLLRLLSNLVMLPHHYVRTEASWRWSDADGGTGSVLDYLPEKMKPDLDVSGTDPLDGFVQGMRVGDAGISVSDVPWAAWIRPLGYWLPLFVVLSVALVGLALAVHKQWSDHEHLPYPVVKFTVALLPRAGEAVSPIFRNRLFWVGTVGVVLFHTNNYLYEWYPEYLIRIPRIFNFTPLARLSPTFLKGGGWSLFFPKIYFSFIAIAFLLATDVSLAVGLGPFIFRYIGGIMVGYGIPMGSGTRFAPRIDRGIVFGGYVGMFLSILYTGRHYYLNLVRRGLGLRSGDEIPEGAIWGLRVFVLGMLVFVIDLCLVGLDWQLAVLYSGFTTVICLVMGRIIAETGLFFIAPYLYPCVLIYSFFGDRAIGPQALMIMFMLTCAFLIDPRETLMPYVVNGVKLLDDCEVKTGRTAALCVLAIVLGLCVATPLTLYFQYDRGVNWNDGWDSRMVPKFSAEEIVRVRQRLMAQDVLEESEATTGWRHFANPTPDRRSMIAFLAGLGGVLVFAAGRLRFPKWPLHPVLFLVWGGWAGYQTAWPFLMGCGLKVAATKYGGISAYQRIKPLMFGLIAGDMLSGLGITLFGLIYHLVTGELPTPYRVLLG